MLSVNTAQVMTNIKIKNGFLVIHAWFKADRDLIHSSSSPVVFVKLLRDIIKTTSPASRKIQPRCNAFLIKVFLPFTTWLFRSHIATLMKHLPPVTTNEKFIQYYCWAE
jgi:hypothetical protein